MSLRPGRGGQPAEPLLAPAAVSTAPTAAVVAAWFLWVLAAIFALVAMILAAIILSRANSNQDGVNDLLACCSYVSTTVTTILSDIFAIGEFLFIEGCTPLFGPQTIDTPGCYFFVFEIECTGAGITCFPIPFTDDVTVDMRGLSLTIDSPDSAGFAPSVANNVKILNGWIMTPVASNISTSRGINAAFADNLQVINVRMTNLFRPIANVFSNGFTVERAFIENANQPNLVGFGNRVIGMMGVNDVLIETSKFKNNNVFNDTASATYGIAWITGDGAPADGFMMLNCELTDTVLLIRASGIVDGNTAAQIVGGTISVSDPLFGINFIELLAYADNNTLGATIVGVSIRDVTFVNNNSNPYFDGIVANGVSALEITDCEFFDNANGFSPQFGSLITAIIHLGSTNGDVDVGLVNLQTIDGAYIARNKLFGAHGPADASNQRANTAIRVEGARNVKIIANHISGIAAGMPANPGTDLDDHDGDDIDWGECAQGQYPAQQPAAIWIAAGCVGIEIEDNNLWDGACATGDWTIPASAIVLAGNESRIS